MTKQQQWQAKEILHAPTSCRGVLERAYTGQSKAAGIKAFCLRCVGYQRAEVTNCTSWGCPLHPYRPFQAVSEADEDAADPGKNEGIEPQNGGSAEKLMP